MMSTQLSVQAARERIARGKPLRAVRDGLRNDLRRMRQKGQVTREEAEALADELLDGLLEEEESVGDIRSTSDMRTNQVSQPRAA